MRKGFNSNWLVYAKRADFKGIQERFGIDQVIARIMRNRDVITDEEIQMYLNGGLEVMHNPLLMKDLSKAVDIIIDKIRQNKKIRIIGDYDIDGVCSITILYKAFKRAGADSYSRATRLKQLNDERKQMTEDESQKAIEMVETSDMIDDNVLVVYLPDCHESIAGIIAGRLREKFYKPVLVITNAEDGAKGSGRSIDGYNMFEEISKCADLLTKFGGHPMAAGLSLPIENIDEFRRRLNINQRLTDKELTPVVWIDERTYFAL